jgi:hypothetical protein
MVLTDGDDMIMKRLGFIVLALFLSCEASHEPENKGYGTISFALDSSVIAEIQRLDVVVKREDGSVAGSTCISVSPGLNVAKVAVPIGEGYVVTAIGYKQCADSDCPANDCSAYAYGRRRGIRVGLGGATDLQMVLLKVGGFAKASSVGDMTNRAFPTVVDLGDGRVLVAGGFKEARAVRGGGFELSSASVEPFVFDGTTGQVVELNTTMRLPRGAASGVLVNIDEPKVMIFGGAKKMTIYPSGGDKLVYVSDEDTKDLDSFEVFDVKTMRFLEPGELKQTDDDWKMSSSRVLPLVLVMADKSLVVLGGPTVETKDKNGDFIEWKEEEVMVSNAEEVGDGGEPEAQKIVRPVRRDLPEIPFAYHFAPSGARLQSVQGRFRYLVFGGTTNGQGILELYTEASSKDVSGSFEGLTSGIPKIPYMMSFLPLTGADVKTNEYLFLAVGGAFKEGNKFNRADTAYVIGVVPDKKLVHLKSSSSECAKRLFYSAFPSVVPGKVVMVGGFRGEANDPGALTCFFDVNKFIDLAKQGQSIDGAFFEPPAGEGSLDPPRGAHGALRLENDAILLVGGLSLQDNTLSGSLPVEIYAPSTIDPQGR